MNKDPLLDLEALGQSVWLDFLRRSAIDEELRKPEDG